MKEKGLRRRQLAWKIIGQLDALASGEPDPRVEIKPLSVTARGRDLYVVVMTEEAWTIVKQMLADSGCRELVNLVN